MIKQTYARTVHDNETAGPYNRNKMQFLIFLESSIIEVGKTALSRRGMTYKTWLDKFSQME